MIPFADPLKAVLGLALLFGALGAILVEGLLIVLALRRPQFATPAFLAGAASVFTFAAYLLGVAFRSRELFPTFIAAWFFAPVALGLIAMVVGGARVNRRRAITAVALVPTVIIALQWRSMERRVSLHDAILHGDIRAARSLAAAGVGSDPRDAAFRQGLLVDAAEFGQSTVVEAFLAAGADPNAPGNGKNALGEAIRSADSLWKPATPDEALRTVTVLLDHGADPHATCPVCSLPIEDAWLLGREDIGRALESRGAHSDVPEQFTALMAAAAGGDVARVKELAAGRLLLFQRGPKDRSPLVVAAENGRADVIDVLVERYGDKLDGRLRDEARHVAYEKNQAAALARLPVPPR